MSFTDDFLKDLDEFTASLDEKPKKNRSTFVKNTSKSDKLMVSQNPELSDDTNFENEHDPSKVTLFLAEDARRVLRNKKMAIIGDSVQRSMYKDLILLLQKNTYLTDRVLRTKGEHSCHGDKLIEGGQKGQMTNSTGYQEVREFVGESNTVIRFYFVTRCYNEYIIRIFNDFKRTLPDIILMNSCLWDINRYGDQAVAHYKKNLEKFFNLLDSVSNPDTLFVWNTTLPVAEHIRGGFLLPETEHFSHALRLELIAANFYVNNIVRRRGYDILDLHYHFKRQIHRRAKDGVHWDQTATRRISVLILSHISKAFGKKLPQYTPKAVEEKPHNIPNFPTSISSTKSNTVSSASINALGSNNQIHKPTPLLPKPEPKPLMPMAMSNFQSLPRFDASLRQRPSPYFQPSPRMNNRMSYRNSMSAGGTGSHLMQMRSMMSQFPTQTNSQIPPPNQFSEQQGIFFEDFSSDNIGPLWPGVPNNRFKQF